MDKWYRMGKSRFLLEQKLMAVEAFEEGLSRQRLIPDTRRLLLRRCRFLLQLTGGFMIALNVSVIAMVMLFIVLNKVFHVSF